MFNVLRGEMSLVGPRPVLPWEAEMFEERYQRRFVVKPGMTGLWQVSGRSRLTDAGRPLSSTSSTWIAAALRVT